MLKQIALRDFVIVPSLELELHAGFTVLTGETGAGKSILIDALQLALGHRGDAGVVREGAARAEISAEFDTPAALRSWLAEAGFTDAEAPADEPLLLRRTLDAQGKSRAWINGRAATIGQLREAGEHLVDIHGQHAWQGLTRPDAVRALLDGYARLDTRALAEAWTTWRSASERLADARERQSGLEAERERLQWQISEVDKLAPGAAEWPDLDAEHRRLSHAQAIVDAARTALQAVSEDERSAEDLMARAIDALDEVVEHDAALREPLDELRSAQTQLQDAAHTLQAVLRREEQEPEALHALDERLALWVNLARRHRRPPEDLPALLAAWRDELARLDAATDLDALEREQARCRTAWDGAAKAVSAKRHAAAPKLAAAVTAAMQQLGMAGGRFEVALEPLAEPQRYGNEAAEFRVAGHAGSTPRTLAKVASGGELSRIALAIAVTTSELGETGTLIFDEIDAADAVGGLMRRLGRDRQVLCVTHLPQVAACADRHCVVSKAADGARTASQVRPVDAEARTQEIARMLGGAQDRSNDTSLAHARSLLQAAVAPVPARDAPGASGERARKRA